jgi:trans-aconitate methyltransferase
MIDMIVPSIRSCDERESAAWERRRDEPEHRELVKQIADELANVVAPPGPVADLGCGPGAHAFPGRWVTQEGFKVPGPSRD